MRLDNYGSPGPSARHMNNRSGKWKRKSLFLGSNTLNNEAGHYVELFINEIHTKFLVNQELHLIWCSILFLRNLSQVIGQVYDRSISKLH